MKIYVQEIEKDSYRVTAKRTRSGEQRMAGYDKVPKKDVGKAAEMAATAMRGSEKSNPREDWSNVPQG